MTTILRPQPGPQEKFLASPADIAIYGGSAGGGKTYALLLECCRHISNRGFRAVIFRRTSGQITNAGGLYDTAMEIYPGLGAKAIESPYVAFKFPSGSKISMMHMQYDKDALSWQGSQIPLVCYDELTHFTAKQFWYLVSRGRNSNQTAGITPYIRATCNPDPDSFVAELIAWWIDQDTGLAIPERSGVIRWFIRVDNNIIWADSKQELIDRYGSIDAFGRQTCMPKSFTFVSSSVYDNKILLKNNPEYLANLKALPTVEREQLLNGNWKIRAAAGLYFPRWQTNIVSEIPGRIISFCRAWDLAATIPTINNPSPDATAGILMGRLADGRTIVLDVQHGCLCAADVRGLTKYTAMQDKLKYGYVPIRLPQDPGQAGKEQAASYIEWLKDYYVTTGTVSGSKIVRAEPFAAAWQQNKILLMAAPWNEKYITELDGFPQAAHDDLVDASSDSFSGLQDVADWSCYD